MDIFDSKTEYERCIAEIKRFISIGDTYQVNYTYRLRRSDRLLIPFHFFVQSSVKIRRRMPAIFRHPDGNLFFSPELFFQLEGTAIRSRPMKGTHIRGRTAEEDDLFYSSFGTAGRIAPRTS